MIQYYMWFIKEMFCSHCDKKCHLVDKYDVNFQGDSTMYGEKIWRNRVCACTAMRIGSIHGFSLERSQVGAIKVVAGLKVGGLDLAICQQRK